jgi:hypothetical protein
MAKEFYVELGGKSRKLAFRSRDGIELKNRFKKPLVQLLREDVMGLDADSNITGSTDLEVQAAFITAGIRRAALEDGDPKGRVITEDKVLDWIDDHHRTGEAMGVIVEPVYKAFFLSGVLGHSYDLDAEYAKLRDVPTNGNGKDAGDRPGPGDEGKGEVSESAVTPPPAIRAAE